MTGALSDQEWADICAAAGRTPDAEARAALSKALFEDYPAFAHDREHWAKEFKRSQRMRRQIERFAADYRALFARTANVTTERDLWCIDGLQRRTEAAWDICRVTREANAKRKDPQRELLYHWLCNVWVNHFHGKLTVTVPPIGGAPRGPLIKFIFAALRQVVSADALPSPETVRDAIADEREGRDKLQRERKKPR